MPVLSRSLVGALVFVVAACDPPPSGSCAPACATQAPACPNGCPALADEVCVDGACVGVDEGVVDVAVTVSVDRNLDGVVALAVGLIDARVAGCADVDGVADAEGVLAGNRIEVSGGSFHPDLRVGLIPAVAVSVAVDALDVDGAVVARGCVDLDAAATTVTVLVE